MAKNRQLPALTEEQWYALARTVAAKHLGRKQTKLVEFMLRKFDWFDDIVNPYGVNPGGWSVEECVDWVQEQNLDLEAVRPSGWELPKRELFEDETGYRLEWRDMFDRSWEPAWHTAILETAAEYMPEVHVWYSCSDEWGQAAKEVGEIVLENEYGVWWGRTTTEPPVYWDPSLRPIFARFYKDKGVDDVRSA